MQKQNQNKEMKNVIFNFLCDQINKSLDFSIGYHEKNMYSITNWC
jgi:hypothetical protein